MTAGTFTIPTAVLQALPPTYVAGKIAQGGIVVHQQYTTNFTAPGIDIGYAQWDSGSGDSAITFK